MSYAWNTLNVWHCQYDTRGLETLKSHRISGDFFYDPLDCAVYAYAAAILAEVTRIDWDASSKGDSPPPATGKNKSKTDRGRRGDLPFWAN